MQGEELKAVGSVEITSKGPFVYYAVVGFLL